MDFDLLDLNTPIAPVTNDHNVQNTEEKHSIIVEYEGNETQVSWYKGQESKDIEEAIICACDSIIDQGFILKDSSGFPTLIGQVTPGEKYYMVPGEEISGIQKIVGNKLRRITVEIDPLQHVESVKALEIMKTGTNLLKHTRNSVPHIRPFQLTNDLKHVFWCSTGKSQEKASILIENCSEIVLGQKTETFLNYPIPALDHLSFSIIHSKGTLDLTCRDEREYDF